MYYSLKEIIYNQQLISLSPFIFWTFVISAIFLFCLFIYTKSLKREQNHKLYKSTFHAAMGQRIITGSNNQIIVKTNDLEAFFESKKNLNFKSLIKLLSTSQANAELLTEAIKQSQKNIQSRFEISYTSPQNSYKSIIIHVSPIVEKNKTTKVLWRFDDITKRKKIYNDLKKETRLYSSYLNEAPIGYFSVNKDGKFIFVNDTFCNYLNYNLEELKNQKLTLHDLLSCPPNRTAPYLISHAAHQTPKFQQQKIELISKSGKILSTYIHHQLVFNADGEMIKTRSLLLDAHKADQLFHDGNESEKKYASFFDSAPNAVILINERLKIIDYNPAFIEFFSQIPKFDKKLKRAKLLDFISDEDHDALSNDLTELINSSQKTTITEVKIDHPSQDLVVHIFASNVKKTNLETQIILHFIDVTEQKLLELQFTQSQKMQAIGQLAGGVAHDFNNLLTAIVGHCDLLLLRHRAGDPSFHDLMQVKQNANRGANLVRQLLAFSRQQTLQPKMSDLTEILADLNYLLRRLIGETIDFKIKYANNLWSVVLDQGQFEQVIINLVVNARDAMDINGKLIIETLNVTKKRNTRIGSDVMPPGDFVCIKVIDTGSGIPPAIQERIFDPFFSTKDIGSGTGLGLSTVYGIVRQTNGFITVDSDIGKGTTFSIYLPRHIPTEKDLIKKIEKKHPQKITGPSIKAKTEIEKIMLVEDEDAVRAFSARALEKKGYEIIQATSGVEGLKSFKEHSDSIDLIISDVIMPELGGFELIEEVQKTNPEIRVIFISGYAEEQFSDKFDASTGNITFLPKPYTLQELVDKVRSMLN